MRLALAHVSRDRHSVAVAARPPVRCGVRKVADPMRPRWPKLAEPMDIGEHHGPVCMTFVTFPDSTGKSCIQPTQSRA